MKGFDIYMYIDKMLNLKKWRDLVNFTYRKSKKYIFKNYQVYQASTRY